jgi:hypothetical protein
LQDGANRHKPDRMHGDGCSLPEFDAVREELRRGSWGQRREMVLLVPAARALISVPWPCDP